MKNHPLVSVIIATYNRSDLLKEAIQSVLNQEPPKINKSNERFDIEVLVCDDGSTDNTKEVVQSFGDERVRHIDCGRNGRPSIPRNIGIQNAHGTWIANLDHDDTWEKTKLVSQLAYVKEQHLKACCTNAIRKNIDINKETPYFTDIPTQKYTLADFLTINPVITSSILFHRSLIKKVTAQNGCFPGDNNLIGIDDYALWLRILFYTPIGYLEQPLTTYLDYDKSLRAYQPHKEFDEQYEAVMQDLRAWISQKPFFTRKLFECILNRRLAHKKPIIQQIKSFIKKVLFIVKRP